MSALLFKILINILIVSLVDRDPRWRAIPEAYFAVIDAHKDAYGKDDAAEAQWFSIDALPPLALDHEDIMRDAIALYKEM